jgi:hypothetical protein
MWPFSLLKKKQALPPLLAKPTISAEAFLAGFDGADYLGNAARLGREADDAIRQRRYDEAWRLLHQQKEQYGKHASRYGMTAPQAIALDASVHESLANVRRLEGKHDEALVHLLYCVWSSPQPTKAQEKKVQSYFGRCRFDSATFDDLQRFKLSSPSFLIIRNRVSDWRLRK